MKEKVKNKNENKAQELKEKLLADPHVIDVCVSHIDVHVANLCILYDRQELPAGFLEVVSEYGDLRIEGIDDDNNLEMVAFVS